MRGYETFKGKNQTHRPCGVDDRPCSAGIWSGSEAIWLKKLKCVYSGASAGCSGAFNPQAVREATIATLKSAAKIFFFILVPPKN